MLIANSRRNDYSNIIFDIVLDNNDTTKYRYNMWKSVIPAKYIKKTVNKKDEKTYTMNKVILKSQDALHLLKSTYKEKYGQEIPQYIIDSIIGSDIE